MKTCDGCATDFAPKNRRQRFCSRRCGSRIHARTRLGILDPGLTRDCWWCSTTFELLDGRRFNCSAECARIAGLLSEIQKKYGITKTQYRDAYHAQGGKCAICRKPERTARNTLLAIDHDHVTGHFRGLLCSHCNRAIGLLQDDPKIIRRATEYVTVARQLKLEIAS